LKLGNGTAAQATSKNSSKLEPPRASPPQQPYSIDYYMDGNQTTAFADFTKFAEPSAIDQHDGAHLPPRTTNLTHNRVSAFEIYRKPSSSQSRNSQKSTSPLQQQQLTATETPRRKSIEDNVNYDKRLNSISDNLRQARQFKTDKQNLPDVLRYLREQNVLLLALCNDLSSELLDVQKRKLEIKAKIEMNSDGGGHGPKQVAGNVYNHHAASAGAHHHQTNV
jgi:RalBP1-associated Eps domain-containing protein